MSTQDFVTVGGSGGAAISKPVSSFRWESPPLLTALQEIEESQAGMKPTPGSNDIEKHFQELVRRWKSERGPTSSARRMAAHPAYQEIIRMGTAAIRLLLGELKRKPDHWFIALHQLTGADPVPKESRGRINEMADAWLRWGKENGFIS